MNQDYKKLAIIFIVLLFAGIAPVLFPIAQAGIGKLSSMAIRFLIPAVILVFLMVLATQIMRFVDLRRQILNGMLAGIAGTVGLEIIREIGFRVGGMPGDMPKLMGVLLLDRFALGPDFWSNLAGWAYHFWNGASFGIIFSLLWGQSKIKWAVLYALLISIGFMISPVPRALGIGIFGLQFKDGYQFITTVILAHLAFGSILGLVNHRLNAGLPDIIARFKRAFTM